MVLTSLWLALPAVAQVETPRRRSVPAYPAALRGVVPPDLEVRCRAAVRVGARGNADQIEVAECPQPYADAAGTSLRRWRWNPGAPRTVDVGVIFVQNPRVAPERAAANPAQLAFDPSRHLPRRAGVIADAGECLPTHLLDDRTVSVRVCNTATPEGRVSCDLIGEMTGSRLDWRRVQCQRIDAEGVEHAGEGAWPTSEPLWLVRTGPGTSRWASLSDNGPAHPAFQDYGVYRMSDAVSLSGEAHTCVPAEAPHPPVIPRDACESWGSVVTAAWAAPGTP